MFGLDPESLIFQERMDLSVGIKFFIYLD